MAERYNGVNSMCGDGNISPVEAEVPSSPVDTPKILPLEIGFRGFIPFPHVRLERYDIAPYLNGLKKPRSGNQPEKKRGKKDLHAQKLSQRCLVKLRRDDLENLLAAFRKSRCSSPASSDCEATSDMAVTCKICDKSYNSEKKLLKHQQNKHIIYKTPNKTPKRVSFSDHVIVHEVKEYHKCRKCPKIFEDYLSLKQHMRLWHKKRKCYICNYCHKKFVDRMFFKVHIRLHCDVCGDLFQSRSKYLEHRRDICRIYKLHKCKTCNETFFKIMDLKDHSYDHMAPCFVCDICKEQLSSKCAIAHHIAFLHSTKKRPKELYVMRKMGTERLYLCKFCDESSVDRDVIETHIQNLSDLSNKVTTGYKDYYFCDQCMDQFETETEMLQHKWSHFLKTSDNSQLRPSTLANHIKKTYNVNEKLPDHFNPYVVLEMLDKLTATQYLEVSTGTEIDESSNNPGVLKKAIVDPKSKKTLLSKHRCEVNIVELKYALSGLTTKSFLYNMKFS